MHIFRIFLCFGLLFSIGFSRNWVKADDNSCAQCHPAQTAKWNSSHHAQAMAVADKAHILGDFADVTISHHGQTAVFTKKQGNFFVSMTDKGHKSRTYRIAYSFGVSPLQQYLVKTSGGRYQLLPFAWDSRPEGDGGQRWFYIYPDELPPGDRLHWQQPLQNWNGMCADCHSTGLKRGYDPEKDVFKTSFTAVNVSCSSCHAGATEHAGARQQNLEENGWRDKLTRYKNDIGRFTRKPGEATARWSGKLPRARPLIEVCAACHSQRAPLTDGIDPSRGFLDQFSPSLLDDGLYFADGQQRDEVYIWGSFLQSKMFRAGVSCDNCHDSHSLKLKFSDNRLCGQCHAGAVYDRPEHHHHDKGGEGAQCVSCHMPERRYMVVDSRRDHSFKIPRPDLSASIGVPNACVSCHDKQTNSWAAKALNRWFPNSKHPGDEAKAIYQARRGNPGSRKNLLKLIQNKRNPVITRATALSLIPNVADATLISEARLALPDKEPLIRIGAARAMVLLAPAERLRVLKPLLDDKVKAVRVEAARQLLDSRDARVFKRAFDELNEADIQAAWRGEGRLNMAINYEFTGRVDAAEREYRKTLDIDPAFAPAVINLSELLRRRGQDQEASRILQEAVKGSNVDPSLFHAYGLSLIRNGQRTEALSMLKRAIDVAPDNPRYVYVYLVALNSMGKKDAAYRGLKAALLRHRYDATLLNFGISIALQRRDTEKARLWVKYMMELSPDNQGLTILLKQIQSRPPQYKREMSDEID
ncbi:probable deca-heme c-type cytochrome [hydrothermal vent metagenome]|uniref:Probable deca-heme c-type cytochrome n=1 Tax=hydrothermal vent metagenome TaxID=652676 RepID=A0A3B0UIG4_9ZZZZ